MTYHEIVLPDNDNMSAINELKKIKMNVDFENELFENEKEYEEKNEL